MNWSGEIPDVSALDNSSKTDLILSLWQMMNSSSAIILLNLLILGLFSFCVFLSHMLFVLLCFVFNVYQFYFSVWFYTISICQLHTKSSVIFWRGWQGGKKVVVQLTLSMGEQQLFSPGFMKMSGRYTT